MLNINLKQQEFISLKIIRIEQKVFDKEIEHVAVGKNAGFSRSFEKNNFLKK